jgi:predicted porin
MGDDHPPDSGPCLTLEKLAMKKSLIALAVLAASGASFAQSTVTLSGQLDIAYQKIDGSAAAMTETHGSRFRMVGTEDLGGGLKANFNIEHRLNLKNGANSGFAATAPTNGLSQDTFWNGISTVGVSGGFGTVNFGRQYTAGFISAINKADPFGGDGAGALRAVGMYAGATLNTNGTLRVAQSLGYTNNFGPVSVHLTTGDKTGTGATQRHTGFAIGYAAGPLSFGYGADEGVLGEETSAFYAGYDLGVANLTAGFSQKTVGAAKTKGQMVAVSVPMGAGVIKAGYATAKNDVTGATTNQKVGLGYSYSLSKRTRIDTTYGNDSKLTAAKSGYDITLTHAF